MKLQQDKKAIRTAALSVVGVLVLIGIVSATFIAQGKGYFIFKDDSVRISDNIQINNSLVVENTVTNFLGRLGDLIVEGDILHEGSLALLFCDLPNDADCSDPNLVVDDDGLTVGQGLDTIEADEISSPEISLQPDVRVEDPLVVSKCISTLGENPVNCDANTVAADTVTTSSVVSADAGGTVTVDAPELGLSSLYLDGAQNICQIKSGATCPAGYRDGGNITEYTNGGYDPAMWDSFLGTGANPKSSVCCKLDAAWSDVPRGSVTLTIYQEPLETSGVWESVTVASTRYKIYVDGVNRGVVSEGSPLTINGLSKNIDHVLEVVFYDKDPNAHFSFGVSGNWISYWDPNHLVKYSVSIQGGSLESGGLSPVTSAQHEACLNSDGWSGHGYYDGSHYFTYPDAGTRNAYCFSEVTATTGRLEGQSEQASRYDGSLGVWYYEDGLGEAAAARGYHVFTVN